MIWDSSRDEALCAMSPGRRIEIRDGYVPQQSKMQSAMLLGNPGIASNHHRYRQTVLGSAVAEMDVCHC